LNTTGGSNTAIGNSALLSNTTGGKNTAVGRQALTSNTTASNNIAVGYQSLKGNTTGTENIAVGVNALESNTTGHSNIAIGLGAYDAADTENDNLAIGTDALGGAIAGGEFNVAIGNYSLDANTSGDENVAVGYGSLGANTTGKGNTAIGSEGLKVNSTGDYNTAIGSWALHSNTTGDGSTAIGSEALKANTTGSSNTAIGSEALKSNTTGTQNVATGSEALKANTTGNYNTATGLQSLYANTTGSSNTATGIFSLNANTTGDKNTATGYSLYANTTGDENVAMGYDALAANTTANYNVAIGNLALGDANRTADANAYNTAIGYKAGNTGSNDITTGDNNVLIGAMTTASQAAASNQIVIGSGADGHGDNIAVIGNENLNAIHPGTDNSVDLGSSSYEYKNLYVDGVAYLDGIGMGSTAMTLPTADGSNGQVLKTNGSGTLSWGAVSGGASNIAGLSDALIETNSMYLGNDPSSTTNAAMNNLAVGTTALDAVTTGDNNTAIGYAALSANTTADYSTAYGSESLKSNTTGSMNNALGAFSLLSNTTGTENLALGVNSLYSNTTGEHNVALGNFALKDNTTGGYNTAVGTYALHKVNRTDNSMAENTAIGYAAGFTGTNNLTTGNKNVLLGTKTAVSQATATNQVVIGYGATGHGDNIAVIGNTDMNAWHPADNNGVDLGSSSYNFKDLYLSGEAVVANGSASAPSVANEGDLNTGIFFSADDRVDISTGGTAQVTFGGSYAANFNGNIEADRLYAVNTSTASSSDIRHKKNIKSLDSQLDKVKQLNPVEYEWKDKREEGKIIGLIAQEVQKIYPNMVVTGKDDYLFLVYPNLIVPLIKSVQEQQDQIEALQAQINSLLAAQEQTVQNETTGGDE